MSVRIRLVHAMVRRLLDASDDWDHEAWGTPVSAAHTGFAITAFSARSLKHLKSLGAKFDDEERASFMQVWRYSGHLMGIPETILFREESDALETFKVGLACEPEAELESVSLANALVNSSPLIAGVMEPAARRKLAHYVFQISRALIGPEVADQLMFPRYPTFGVLWWFRMQNRYDDLMNRLFKSRARKNNKLSQMLDVSMVDDEGLSYRLPDHVHAEESHRW
ncbi:MAG: oxygenase MpaB family protein [Chloroflexota bacterium]|nr:oxygenase MpaB family protein [Chloroflexota bacterium]